MMNHTSSRGEKVLEWLPPALAVLGLVFIIIGFSMAPILRDLAVLVYLIGTVSLTVGLVCYGLDLTGLAREVWLLFGFAVFFLFSGFLVWHTTYGLAVVGCGVGLLIGGGLMILFGERPRPSIGE